MVYSLACAGGGALALRPRRCWLRVRAGDPARERRGSESREPRRGADGRRVEGAREDTNLRRIEEKGLPLYGDRGFFLDLFIVVYVFFVM